MRFAFSVKLFFFFFIFNTQVVYHESVQLLNKLKQETKTTRGSAASRHIFLTRYQIIFYKFLSNAGKLSF